MRGKDDRDRLLGAPTGLDPANANRGAINPGKWIVGILCAAVFLFAVAAAYLVGQKSTEQPAPAPTVTRSTLTPVAAPQAPHPPIAAKPMPQQLALGPIGASDWEKLGMGCACAFEVGKKIIFVAGGDNRAILRPNGIRKVCALGSEQFTHLYENNEGKIECAGSRLSILGRGNVTPGEDGHSMSARMTAEGGGQEVTLSGHWNCQC